MAQWAQVRALQCIEQCLAHCKHTENVANGQRTCFLMPLPPQNSYPFQEFPHGQHPECLSTAVLLPSGELESIIAEGVCFLYNQKTAQRKDPVFLTFPAPVSSTAWSSRGSHVFVCLFLEGPQCNQMCIFRRPLPSRR